MCKWQTSVSHSSTVSEIISLEAGLRLDGTPALDLWDLIVAVLGNTNQNRIEQGDLLKNKREVSSTPHTIHKRNKELFGIDGEPIQFEWTIFQGRTTLQILQKIQDKLEACQTSPDEFIDRAIFMSLFNDIVCTKKGNFTEWCFCNLLSPHQTGWSPERFSTRCTTSCLSCCRAG